MLKGPISIKKTLFIVFIILGIINIVAYFILYSTMSSEDTRIIISERNGTLSQKIAYHTNLFLQGKENAKDFAGESIALFQESLEVLKNGGNAVGLQSDLKIDKATGKALAQTGKIENLWQTFLAHTDIVLKASPGDQETNDEVRASLEYINSNAAHLLDECNSLTAFIINDSKDQNLKMEMFLFGSVIILLISFFAAAIYMNSFFVRPIDYFKQKLQSLAEGEYDQQVKFEGKEEYNLFATYLSQVFNKIRLMASFIESIGQGKLDFKVDDSASELVKNDKIFNSLVKTQSELIKVENENQIRQWTNEGIRTISELLQKRYDQVQDLYDKLVATIVKYVDGNQGGMFLATGEEKDIQLELVACYAYERKKFLHEKFDPEEGLLGQAFKEKNVIYLTEVPDQYVRITSGLGRSTPDSVILVPLKDNETVVGVLEIAAFGKIDQHKREFLEKISELIASALNTIMVNERTKYLLSESQQQAEEMRAQEEEMRQNMEELQATQEEMVRKEREISKLLEETSGKEKEMQKLLKEMQGKERFLDSLINVSTDSIMAVDPQYNIVSFNKKMGDTYKATGVHLKKGLDILSTFPDDGMRDNFKSLFGKAFQGESLENTLEVPSEQGTTYYLINHAPIRNEKGEITAAVMYSKDISALVRAQKEAEALLGEAQTQAEQMRAQEEELMQNMEEMASIQDELEKRATEAEKVKEKLEIENAMFSSLMDVLNDRITVKDTKGIYLRVNKTKEESMKEAGINDYRGKTDADIFDQEHYKKSLELEKKIMTSGKPVLNELNKVAMKDGSALWLNTNRVPFRNHQGDVLGTLIVSRDITTEKVYEEKLRQTGQEVEELKKKLKNK